MLLRLFSYLTILIVLSVFFMAANNEIEASNGARWDSLVIPSEYHNHPDHPDHQVIQNMPVSFDNLQ